MGTITFKKYCERRGITLRPWQEKAARAFLAEVHKNREGKSGKTYLIDLLHEFTCDHGLTFELDQE